MSAPIDWDRWRADYDRMSFAEHQAFNAGVARAHPVQRQFDTGHAEKFLDNADAGTVLEVGGWDGGLAKWALDKYEIERWTNYDITPNVPQECDDARYERVVLSDWPWNTDAAGDVLIASHVLEHMLMHEVEQLFDRWKFEWALVDVPIGPQPRSWQGYEGTHIIDVGSIEFLARLRNLGFEAIYQDPDAFGLVAWLERQ